MTWFFDWINKKKNTLSESEVMKLWSSIFRSRLYADITVCGYFATVSPSSASAIDAFLEKRKNFVQACCQQSTALPIHSSCRARVVVLHLNWRQYIPSILANLKGNIHESHVCSKSVHLLVKSGLQNNMMILFDHHLLKKKCFSSLSHHLKPHATTTAVLPSWKVVQYEERLIDCQKYSTLTAGWKELQD